MHSIFPATEERLARWKAQPEVLSVLLVGSKSQGHADELSDDDLEVLLTHEAFKKRKPDECSEFLIEEVGEQRKVIYDTQYVSLTSLEHKLFSSSDLDHWPYERAQILFDRNGSVTPLVESLGRMSPDFRRKRLQHSTIDAWIAAARAKKALLRGFEAASRLTVARGIKALSRVLFALEWRWVPLDHWLDKELQTLNDPTHATPLLIEALKTGNPDLIDQALTGLEGILAAEGIPGPAGRHALFFELVHPERSKERAVHGLH